MDVYITYTSYLTMYIYKNNFLNDYSRVISCWNQFINLFYSFLYMSKNKFSSASVISLDGQSTYLGIK